MAIHLPEAAPVPRDRWSLNPSQVALLSFSAFILVGAILLSLPITHAGPPHHWVDDLFTAASAVCVTGLVTIDPGSSYNGFGLGVLLLLIQIGGLGYMTLFTLSMLLIGKRLSMRDRLTLQQAMERPGMTGLVDFLKHIVGFTLAVEGLGFLILAVQTVPELGWSRGLHVALFHAVSAFNNAGFSLFKEGAVYWQHQPGVLVTLSALVIVGGLGYTVNHELMRRYLFRKRPESKWNLLLVIVLGLTGVLITSMTALFWLFESNNPATLGALPPHEQLANAFFMAVQPRTAGFNSLDMGALERPTLLMTIVAMFIGAGPGGTAGGIKLTTLAILMAGVMAAVYGRDEIVFPGLKRRVGEKIARKALAVFVLSLVVVVAATMAITALEPLPFLSVLFEVTSAFATVGLSVNLTPSLSDASKLILVLVMLVGRVGMLAVMMSFFTTRRTSRIRYVEEPLLVG